MKLSKNYLISQIITAYFLLASALVFLCMIFDWAKSTIILIILLPATMAISIVDNQLNHLMPDSYQLIDNGIIDLPTVPGWIIGTIIILALFLLINFITVKIKHTITQL